MLEPLTVYQVVDYWTQGQAVHFPDPETAERFAGKLRSLRDTCGPGRVEVRELPIRTRTELLDALNGAAGRPPG